MREPTPAELITKIERKFRRHEHLQLLLRQLAISALGYTGGGGAKMLFDDINKTDTLPHD